MNVSPEQILSLIESTDVLTDIATLKGDSILVKAGIDSLEMMNILLAIEEQYDIKIPDEDIDALDTIDHIVAYLNAL